MYARGTAEVDWCEHNYVHNNYIAEFFNTISSIPLIGFPIFGYYFNKSYLAYVNPNVKYVYYLFVFVGITSAYFHATLSLLGQLLDELGLLWVGVVSFMVWLPRMRSTPPFMKRHSTAVNVCMFLATVVSSVLTFVQPALNAYLLMFLCVPTFISMYKELRLANDPAARHIGFITTVGWSLGVSVWISDRSMCSIWIQLGIPYFHAVWHVLSAYSSYCAIVLFSYLDATVQAPSTNPEIRYIPRHYFFQVPYLHLSPIKDNAAANGAASNGLHHVN